MSLYRTITPADLDPHGMQCEACGHVFVPGDEYTQALISFTDSTPRDFEVLLTPEQRSDVDDWDAPIPILGDTRCRACFESDNAVKEAS